MKSDGFELSGTLLDSYADYGSTMQAYDSLMSKGSEMIFKGQQNLFADQHNEIMKNERLRRIGSNINAALSKQKASFSGRGISSGVSADAISRLSEKRLNQQRDDYNYVTGIKSLAMREQARYLIDAGGRTMANASSAKNKSNMLNVLNTGLNIAQIFA